LISAREETWLRIQADESPPREILLLKGQTLSLPARKRFLLTIGNAGGVQMVLDGEKVPLAGSSGQVIRDLVLPPKKEG
jgi:cytoskeleton protein RodZ